MNSFSDVVEEIKSIISSEYAPKKVFDKDVAFLLQNSLIFVLKEASLSIGCSMDNHQRVLLKRQITI